MDDCVYKVRRSPLRIVLSALSVVAVAIWIYCAVNLVHGWLMYLCVFVMVVMLVSCVCDFLSACLMRYEIKGGILQLYPYYGLSKVHKDYDVKEMSSVECCARFSWSCFLKRYLAIRFSDGRKYSQFYPLTIVPEDEEKFLADICRINPEITVK